MRGRRGEQDAAAARQAPPLLGLQLPGFGFPLQGHHPGEFAAGGFQLPGRSLLGDVAVFEDDHLVGGFDRTHAVRDHDDRFAC